MSRKLIIADKKSPLIKKDFIDKERHLRVSEFFSRTIQGEGIYTGHPAAFLRLQGCALKCSWCDSASVWKYGQPYNNTELIEMMYYHELIADLKKGSHLVITGGSPLLQQKRLILFLNDLIKEIGFKPFIEIENECVILPEAELIPLIDCWNNSPKLLNSGNAMKKAYKPDLINYMSKLSNSWFKFVISEENDWEIIGLLYLQTGLIKKNQIILMPEGLTREQIFANQGKVAERAIKNSVKFSNRMHVILWNLQTGV